MAEVKQTTDIPPGVVAVYVMDGRVIAHAASFELDRYGGFTLRESQELRARDRLGSAVVSALASPALFENLGTYACVQIMNKMSGSVCAFTVGEHTDA